MNLVSISKVSRLLSLSKLVAFVFSRRGSKICHIIKILLQSYETLQMLRLLDTNSKIITTTYTDLRVLFYGVQCEEVFTMHSHFRERQKDAIRLKKKLILSE